MKKTLKGYWGIFPLSLSGFAVLASILALGAWGLRPGIDFTGGTRVVFQGEWIQDPTEIFASVLPQDSELVVENQFVTIGLDPIPADSLTSLEASLAGALAEASVSATLVESVVVGPVMGRELIVKTLTALGLGLMVVMAYIWFRFKQAPFGISASLAALHDGILILGVFSVLGEFLNVEIDGLFVTALLTTVSFSVHDTIVVFDRIRELARTNQNRSFVALSNMALKETLIRSLHNSITIAIVLLSLWLLGGESLRYFVLALLLGTIFGTYSSAAVAVPLLVVLQRTRQRG